MRGFTLEVWLLWPPSNISVERNPSQINFKKRPFPICPKPLFQSEAKCASFDMNMIFYCHVNKTHFYKKGFALSLVLKVRVSGTRKWPITI